MSWVSRGRHTVGTYVAEWWGSAYWDETAEKYVKYTAEQLKPNHRKQHVKLITGVVPHPKYADLSQKEYKTLTPEEIVNAEMTVANSSSDARAEQAAELEHHEYHGPVGGGEARVLKSLFAELGYPDLVKHGWVHKDVLATLPPTRWQLRRAQWNNLPAPPSRKVTVSRLQKCYVFKSPMAGVHFSKFIRLARMYKDDDNQLRAAVRALLANPEAHNEIEGLDAIDILAGFAEVK